jgi:hypothetical protein
MHFAKTAPHGVGVQAPEKTNRSPSVFGFKPIVHEIHRTLNRHGIVSHNAPVDTANTENHDLPIKLQKKF